MKPKKEKLIIVLICLAGIGAVGYGMAKENHPIFIVGILFVIAGYLFIRRKLKASVSRKTQS
jgi:hypothetical protein